MAYALLFFSLSLFIFRFLLLFFLLLAMTSDYYPIVEDSASPPPCPICSPTTSSSQVAACLCRVASFQPMISAAKRRVGNQPFKLPLYPKKKSMSSSPYFPIFYSGSPRFLPTYADAASARPCCSDCTIFRLPHQLALEMS